MIIPMLVNHSKCFELLEEISLIIGKDFVTMIHKSFLTIYIYLNLHEKLDIVRKCLSFATEQTGYSLQKLLKFDQKVCFITN